MKIAIETTVGGQYNAETEAWDTFDALTVTYQAGPKMKRTSTTFAFPSSDPEKACLAAAAYFKSQEISS